MAKNQVTLTFAGDEKDLLRSMDRVGDSSRKMTKDVDRANDSFKRGGDGSSAFAGGLTKVLAVGATAAAAIGVVGKELYDLSRQVQDLDRKSGAVFKDQLPAIQKWAEVNRKAFGTSSRNVVAMATNFADLLIPMGFTAKQAATMSTKVLDLAGALSKWSGGTKSVTDVSNILTKAMLGERDELKGLGISISDADVKARLLAKGQEKLTGVAQQQAIALATQQLIFEKSADAQTAWANGGKAAAEAQGALGSSIDTIKEKLAVLLTPAFGAATEAVGTFADRAVTKFDELAPKVQSFVDNELGDMSAALIDLKDNVLAGVKTSLDSIQDSLGGNAESWRTLAGAITDITKIVGPALKFMLEDVGLRIVKFQVGIIAGVIDSLEWAINRAEELGKWLARLTGKLPDTGFTKTNTGGGSSADDRHGLPKFHSGGMVPGAPGSEMVAILQAGERVTPPGASSDRTVIELRSSGSRIDELLIELLARAIGDRGGNVQVVLGR
jgi:hypothetical protein